MGLFSRFNKSQVFSNVNTNDYTYINPKDLYEEVKDTLKIHSPSRVFRDEVDKMMGEGVVVGVKATFQNTKSYLIYHLTW